MVFYYVNWAFLALSILWTLVGLGKRSSRNYELRDMDDEEEAAGLLGDDPYDDMD